MTEIFNQLIYEYQKGMRDLVLYTCGSEYMQALESLFKKHKISYKIRTLDCGKKMNVFFGNPDCLEILEILYDGKNPQASFDKIKLRGVI